MANPFRDMSVIMQILVAVAIAVVLVLVGVYVPASPVAQERAEYDNAVMARTKLTQEVTQLQVYKQRYLTEDRTAFVRQTIDRQGFKLDENKLTPQPRAGKLALCRSLLAGQSAQFEPPTNENAAPQSHVSPPACSECGGVMRTTRRFRTAPARRVPRPRHSGATHHEPVDAVGREDRYPSR